MKPLLSLHAPTRAATPRFLFTPYFPNPGLKSPHHRTHFPVKSISNDSSFRSEDAAAAAPVVSERQQRPRTLYPGGYKRPEIKVPSVVLQLEPDQVLAGGGDVLDQIDEAIAKFVGIVVLNGGEASGKSVYEAACLLKSVVKDRAYFLIAERVDIAAAVNASGVLLSDQEGQRANVVENLLFTNVKIPIFIMNDSREEVTSPKDMSKFLKFGASGLVIFLEDLRLFSDDVLSQLFIGVRTTNEKPDHELENDSDVRLLDASESFLGKKIVAGFFKLEDREKQLIETERSVLLEAIDVVKQAAPPVIL